MIQIKTPDEIALMREAGLVTQRALAAMRAAVRPGVSTGELDRIAEDSIRSEGAVPSFLGYRGFTGTICASINDEVVHGIPSRKRTLREGDIISLDCGAIVEGWHGDSAITVAVGEIRPEHQELIDVTERSLWAGLAAARRRRPADRHQRGGGAVDPRPTPGRTGSSTTTAGTASAPRCTRTRTCSTTAGPAAARGWCRGWRWPSSRWSPWAARAPGSSPTAGRSSPPTGRTRRTGSTPWRSPRTGPG